MRANSAGAVAIIVVASAVLMTAAAAQQPHRAAGSVAGGSVASPNAARTITPGQGVAGSNRGFTGPSQNFIQNGNGPQVFRNPVPRNPEFGNARTEPPGGVAGGGAAGQNAATINTLGRGLAGSDGRVAGPPQNLIQGRNGWHPLHGWHVPPNPAFESIQPGSGNSETGGAGNVARGNAAGPNAATTNTLGQGPAGGNGVGGLSQNLIQSRTGGQVLRNPAFANISARDPANRALAQSTFNGRFAQSGFGRPGGDRDRDADRHHRFGLVIGFLGPVFWPYAYDDFIDYTFSPYAYDTFWPYAYDDVIQGIYGGYAPAYPDSASSGAIVGYPDGSVGYTRAIGGTARICSGQTEGLTDFPIQRIAQQVEPEQAQQALLDDLRAASAQALDVLRAACPSDLPSTPTGRLAAMRGRVGAMLQAVQIVRPALEKFYQTLNDEQKERFNALDGGTFRNAEGQEPDPAQLCGGRARATNLPIARIEQALRLSDAQETALKALADASAKAGDILTENCPAGPTLTPTGRLADMERRLEAIIEALDTVQPALTNFYGSLDDEQKAQFNRLSARSV
jgi:hypothetical protein